MFGGLNRLLLAAFAAGAVLAVTPSLAIACNGGPSAYNVYRECLPTGGGGKPTSGGGGGGSANRGSGTGSNQTTPVTSRASNALKHAPAKDRRVLSALVKAYSPRHLDTNDSGSAAAVAPSAIGSAFDLGSGPTALLVVLAAAGALLLAATALRGRHRSHDS